MTTPAGTTTNTPPHPSDHFAFYREDDGTLSPEGAIHQALGAASVCWESLEGAGVFDSTRARSIGEALIAELGLTR